MSSRCGRENPILYSVREGGKVNKPSKYLLWRYNHYHRQNHRSLYTCHFTHEAPLIMPYFFQCMYLILYAFFFFFFYCVHTYTHRNVGYIQCGIFYFAHRYIPRVEDSTWYTAGTQQVLSGGKMFQVEGTANAKFLRQGTRRSMWLVDNRKRKNSRSKIRKSMWEGQKQGDNQEAITPVYVKKFEPDSSSRGSD